MAGDGRVASFELMPPAKLFRSALSNPEAMSEACAGELAVSELEISRSVKAAGSGETPSMFAERRSGGATSGQARLAPSTPESGDNEENTRGFIRSLRSTFGGQIASQVIATTGVERDLRGRKPLTLRKVNQSLGEARRLRQEYWQTTCEIAQTLSQIDSAAAPAAEGLLHAIREAAGRNYPHNESVYRLVDQAAVSRRVYAAIIAACGADRSRLVDHEEARAIRNRIVDKALGSAFAAARQNALKSLDPQVRGTLMHRSLATAMARYNPPIVLGKSGLTAEAADSLREALDAVIRSGQVPASKLTDETALQPHVDAIVAAFIDGRDRARDAVQLLDIADTTDREALLDRVTRDVVPTSLVAEKWLSTTDPSKLAGSRGDS